MDKIDEINLDVDVTNVTGDTEVELNLPKLDNVKDMSTSTVKVKIDTEKEANEEADPEATISSKELKNLSIGINGVEY